MDQMVLAAQKWVNATYGNHPQYEVIPENGKTGWSTMYALTRGLQIELGISTLSDNFGPTTLYLLSQNYPQIGIGDNTPTNIIKIIQCGMYCKGYPGGDGISGKYTIDTAQGIVQMETDMGLDFTVAKGTVTPKVFKALLTMDAYVLIGEDTNHKEKVRKIQQWLNAKYINRKNFFFMPCDGYFSRNVQQALVYAIQYELGMDDNTANGNFGPGTQAGLKNHRLSLGDQDDRTSFVHLFQAALTFNGFDAPFDGIYGQDTKDLVESFQRFAMLTVNGEADFETWASLLVSTGDPTRKGKACDTVTEITPERAQALKAAGYETVGRYLTNVEGSSLNKKIQPGELQNIFNAGLTVFPIYQTYGGEASYFNDAQGREDAYTAYQAAKGYGFNRDTVIYFAVDFDATDNDIENNVIPHFRAINQVMSSLGDYRIGVYGSRNVCTKVSDAGYAARSFVSGMSTGFSGNLGFPLPSNWAFDQISTISVGSPSFGIDNDIKSGRDLGQNNVSGQSELLNKRFLDNLEEVYNLALNYKKNNNTDLSPERLIAQYYRSVSYSGIDWDIVAGKIDEGFLQYVNNQGVERIRTITDPDSLLDLDTDHLFAAMDGILYQDKLPPKDTPTIGDGAGWMGDFVTTLVDWDNHKSEYDSAYDLARDYIAATKVNGHYNLNDYIEDIDGWNLAYKVKNSSRTTIVDIFRDYYNSEYAHRYSLFLVTRHGGLYENANEAAKSVYSLEAPVKVAAFRAGLLLKYSNNNLAIGDIPNDVKDEIVTAYMDILKDKIDSES